MKPRTSLLLGVLASVVTASVIGFVIVHRFAPDAAETRLFIDLGLVALLAGVVVAFTRSPAQRVSELTEALRELTRGIRSRRLEVTHFGDLEEVARAFNDVAAFLCEHDDPNLGPVKSQPRYMVAPAPAREEHSLHPELGEVRVLGMTAEDQPKRAHRNVPSATPASKTVRLAVVDEEILEPARESAPPELRENDTTIDEAPPDDASGADALEDDGSLTPGERASSTPTENARPSGLRARTTPPHDSVGSEGSEISERSEIPGGSEASEIPRDDDEDDVRALFEAFVAAKQRQDEPTDDLELEAFAEMLADERDKLRAAHKCRAVRFEITVQDGEVSLLPRLLR